MLGWGLIRPSPPACNRIFPGRHGSWWCLVLQPASSMAHGLPSSDSNSLGALGSQPSGLQHAACVLPEEIRPRWSRFSPGLLSDIVPRGNNALHSDVPRKRLPRELGSVCTAPGGPANEQAVVMTLPGPWAITHNIGLSITSALITS